MQSFHGAICASVILLASLAPITKAHAAPDVAVTDVEAPERLFFNRTNEVSARIVNIGTAAAMNFDYRVVLSSTSTINLYDTTILEGGPISLAESAQIVLEETVSIPDTIAPGSYYVGFILDPYRTLEETNRLNNAMAASHRSEVRVPAADLRVSEVRVGAKGAAGETLRVNFTMENRGNMAAQFDYGVYLSHNEIISSHDVLLFQGADSLDVGEAKRRTDYVLLPSGLPAGWYYIGVIADPEGLVEELDLSGNVGRAALPLEVEEADLRLETSWLPDAIVGEIFAWRFVAMGGMGGYEFELLGGGLPPGMELDEELGEISGIPEEPGEYTFVLQVTSGGLTVSAGYVLRVVRPSISLTVNTEALPPAIHQNEYRMQLGASGGQPPFRWTTSSALPPGLVLEEDGVLHGEPSITGSFSLELRVQDDTGQSSRRTLELRVVERGSLAIMTGLLPPGMVGQGYSPVGMDAMGATGYVIWSVVDGHMPPGISLEAESGIIRGIPERTGRFSFRIRARDEAGLSDINSYTIEIVSQPVSIVTQDAMPAAVGEPYEQSFQILPGSGRGPYFWSLLSGVLPAGLILDGDEGVISGTPQEGSEGVYTFGLEVIDSTGANGIRAYVLEVRSEATDSALAIQTEPEGGCETATGGALVAFLLISSLLLFVGARPRLVSAAMVLAFLFTPGTAFSNDAWSYSVIREPQLYQDVSGGTALTAINGTWDGNTRIALPFQFEFYGEMYDQITVSVNGLIGFEAFTSSHHSNQTIPSTSLPNGILAAWWDDLDARPGGAEISTLVLGNAPNRVFVVQWKNVARASGSQLNFQARLYEGTTTIEVHYGSFTGTQTGSASAGIENQSGSVGVQGLSCTSSCGQSHFPEGEKVVYATVPNLVAMDVTAPATVWSGVPAQVSGTVANVGGEDAGPFDVAAVIANDPDEILDGLEVGRTRLLQGLPVGTSQDVTMIVEIPEDVESDRDYWISLIPNPEGEVEDAGGGMNAAEPVVVRVGPPMPNLRVIEVLPREQQVSLGEEVQIAYELANSGNRPADTSYWIVLSTNDVITTQDLVLHEGSLIIEPRSTVHRETSVQIPEEILSGAYYVGVILDPAGEVFEPDVTGNARASNEPIAVVGDGIVVLTDSLPPGRVGQPYSARLLAAGGEEGYRWNVASGELPPGLRLSESGWIDGRPEVAGEFSCQVLVRSGSLLALQSYRLHIDEDLTPLTVVSTTLPGGAVGFDYSARLYATGGEPPYLWRLLEGSIPPSGLMVAEDGRIFGIPSDPGVFDLVVEVSDGSGEAASASLDIEINMTGHLLITTTELPPAVLGETYSHTLRAAGGREPYRWAVDGAAPLPEGLSLAGNGEISGVPEQVGVFDVVAMVRDDRGHNNRNTYSLIVGYTQGLAITTQRLPQATGGWEYDAALEVWSGTAPFHWSIISGNLPDGLHLDEEEGLIHGVPVDDGVDRHVPFIVQVQDSVGRSAMRALSISVGPPPPIKRPEGCSVSMGRSGAGLFLILLSALALMSARRSGRRKQSRVFSKPLVLTLLLALFGFASGCGGGNPCDNVVCPAGTKCAEADGECRCGGPSGELCGDDELCDPASGACVSTVDLCEGQLCTNGFTCDPDDGVCKCGGAGGEICGDDEWCDPMSGRCMAPDPCAGVLCAGEEYCHLETGQCRCGDGEGCPVGERCEAGECVVDLCYGVTCDGGNVCDPSDGTCRCGRPGGPICEPGEVCDPGERECVPEESCDGVVCPGGMSCDPNDGLCKCGGSNGVPCNDDQYCDPIQLVCLGGDPCQDVVCTGGTTCDPEDGMCRCGGHEGEICTDGEWCVEPSGLDLLCSPSCSPVFQDCEDENLGCYYDESSDRTFCYPKGTAAEGAFCNVSSDCEPGHHCNVEGAGRRCRQLCDTAAAYPQPGSCYIQSYCDASFDYRSEIGICIGVGN